MQNNYQENYALCVYGEMDSLSILRSVSLQSVKTILLQMGVEYVDNLPPETYIMAFLDEFTENGDWILKMLPIPVLDYLLDIWEQMETEDEDLDTPTIWVEAEEWEYLQYLRLFGLVTYRKGNAAANEPNVIFVEREMRDLFYFHLRSRKSQDLLDKYEVWESDIRGLMHYYGLIQIEDLHQQFIKSTKESLTLEEFTQFLKIRTSLWTFGNILYDQRNDKQYYSIQDAENPDQILMFLLTHKDIPYKDVSCDDAVYVSDAGGIDNRWGGVSRLGSILLDELEMNYYRATVFVKTILSLVQNAYNYQELEDKFKLVCSDYEVNYGDVAEALELIYFHIPIYELKGHSRKEFGQIQYKLDQKKKRERFKLIKGGGD